MRRFRRSSVFPATRSGLPKGSGSCTRLPRAWAAGFVGIAGDYFFLPVAPPFDTVEKREATLGGSGQFMYVKVKQCKRCHFLELYQPTREEEIQYAKGRELSRAKFP